jgi:hypothetical protein
VWLIGHFRPLPERPVLSTTTGLRFSRLRGGGGEGLDVLEALDVEADRR